MRTRSPALHALIAAGLPAAAFAQFDFEWTGNAGTSVWTDEDNWRNLSFGGIVLGFPDGDDDVGFVGDVAVGSGDAPVFLVRPGATVHNLDTLTINVPWGFVSIETGGVLFGGVIDSPVGGRISGAQGPVPGLGVYRDLTLRGLYDFGANLAGTVRLEGDCRFSAGTAFGPGGTLIDPVEGVVLEGPGDVWLTVRPGEPVSNAFARLISEPGVRASLTNRLDNGIVGYGGFSYLHVINESLIHASGTQPIELFDTTVDNSSGTIRIDGDSFVNLRRDSVIEGGRIEAEPGAEIGGDFTSVVDRIGLRNLEVVGTLRVQGRSDTTLEGDIVLSGEIRNSRTQSTGGMIVRDSTTARLVGGTVTLDTPAFQYSFAGSLRTDPDATLILDGTLVQGNGPVGAGNIINRGVFRPGTGRGGMVMSDVTIDNTQGLIDIPAGGFLWFDGFDDDGSTITGGVIHAEPGSGMSADAQIVTLEDVTITGTLTLGDPDTFSSSTRPETFIRGVLTNNAEISVIDLGPDSPRPAHWLRVWCEETASIGGTGRLVINDRALGGIVGRCFEGGTLVNLAPHEIAGSGEVAIITLENRGTLRVQDGTLLLDRAELIGDGAASIAADGVLRIEESLVRVPSLGGSQGLVELVSGSFETGLLEGSLTHEAGRLVSGFDGLPTQIMGAYQQTAPDAELFVRLTGPSESGAIIVEGAAVLAGHLAVEPADGFTPTPGDRFVFLETRGGVTGTFSGLDEGAVAARFGQTGGFGGVELTITYLAGDGDDVALLTRPAPCGPADLDLPYAVLDQADLTAFVTAFLDEDPAADLSGDGVTDLADIVAFVSAFSAGCP